MLIRVLVLVLLIAGSAAIFAPHAPSVLTAIGLGGPAGETATMPAAQSAAGEVLLRKRRDGHVTVTATVDGRQVAFLVDTGATKVVLDAATAHRLGYRPAAADFAVPVYTANGRMMVAPAVLREITISGITIRDVSALVAPKGALEGNLLGMSFLNRLRRVEFREDGLLLRQ